MHSIGQVVVSLRVAGNDQLFPFVMRFPVNLQICRFNIAKRAKLQSAHINCIAQGLECGVSRRWTA